jgi:IMP dehydrogenase
MVKIMKPVLEGIDYDDVLLVPKSTEIKSRKDINLVSDYNNLYPIISAPMKDISGVRLVKAMHNLNCLGILHRADSIEQRIANVKDLNGYRFGVAIGTNNIEEELSLVDLAIDRGAVLVCVDVANGYLKEVLRPILDELKTREIDVMCGNVVTREGCEWLLKNGVGLVRCGIGGGSQCTTRNITGVGMPQLTALDNCNQAKENFNNWLLVSDGGIKNSGNAVKSFACGADLVMLGKVLAYAEEAENGGKIRGMASKGIQEEWHGSIKSIEGIEEDLEKNKIRPLAEIIHEFLNGIQSACTYLDCNSYIDIKMNAQFVYTGKGTLKQL